MAEDTLGPTEMAAHQSPSQAKLLKYALFILASLLLLAGVVGGYWYGIKMANVKTQGSKPQLKTENLMPTQTISSTLDSTLDWEIYTHSKYGFSLQHPHDAVIEVLSTESNEWGIFERILIVNSLGVIYVPEFPPNEFKYKERKETTVDGTYAEEYLIENIENREEEVIIVVVAETLKDSLTPFYIRFLPVEGRIAQEEIEYFHKVLSTVKFLSQLISPTPLHL